MKLYATTTSERNSRPAKKGGDERLETNIFFGNNLIAEIVTKRVGANGWAVEIWLDGELYHKITSKNIS